MQKLFPFLIGMLIVANAQSQNRLPIQHWTDAVDISYSNSQPEVHYTISIDTLSFAYFDVEMQVRNVRDTFEVAMVRHPEYDDRYWRYVTNFTIRHEKGQGKIQRLDSALWRIFTNNHEATLRYRIQLPKTDGIRDSWKAFLTPSGGMVGGVHSFMYIVDATLNYSRVTLNIPADWKIATGLTPTSDPKQYFANSVFTLTDAPILIGKFNSWSFEVDHVPHRIVYLPQPGAKEFDTASLVLSIRNLVEQSGKLFKRFPYKDYTFLLQDGALSSLEHNNSVVVGAPSDQLANGFNDILPEIAHEYFHTWNLVRIHPEEYGDVTYKEPPLCKGYWFSEGLTLYYADLFLRRSGLNISDSTRLARLSYLIAAYFENPAYTTYSAEKISMSSYAPIGFLPMGTANTHMQGELFGNLFDLIIRNATNGSKTMDDVMLLMMERYSGSEGFNSNKVRKTIQDVCHCDLTSFFNDHIIGSKPIDFNRYLSLIGMKYELEWKEVPGENGKRDPDLSVYLYREPEGAGPFRIAVTRSNGCWAKAGLKTGDELISMNGKPADDRAFYSLLRSAVPGDTITISVKRMGKIINSVVVLTPYRRPFIKFIPLPASPKEQRLFMQWSKY